MSVHFLAQPESRPGKGPIGITLASFREVCLQIHHEADNITRLAQANWVLAAMPCMGEQVLRNLHHLSLRGVMCWSARRDASYNHLMKGIQILAELHLSCSTKPMNC